MLVVGIGTNPTGEWVLSMHVRRTTQASEHQDFLPQASEGNQIREIRSKKERCCSPSLGKEETNCNARIFSSKNILQERIMAQEDLLASAQRGGKTNSAVQAAPHNCKSHDQLWPL